LNVRDDGHGFDPVIALAREHDREHFGLKGIQQRISALGGNFEVQSRSGEGTFIAINIPVKSAAGEDG
jgi:signal transduction histidine kinase